MRKKSTCKKKKPELERDRERKKKREGLCIVSFIYNKLNYLFTMVSVCYKFSILWNDFDKLRMIY